MDSTPNLQLPYLIAAQAQKHVTHNEALRALDAVVQLSVLDKDLASPPGSPADGDAYIVAASPSGAWAGQAGKIAAWQDGAWAFYAPQEGWRAWVADEDTVYFHDGSAWNASLAKLGIGTTPDATNRLSVASPASLFNHAGAGHQVKINKASAGDTASQLFQTGFSGRAEYGLTGDDDWHLKVSPDGSTWREAAIADRNTGAVRFPLSPKLGVQPNLLINPDGRIDQRHASLTSGDVATADDSYGGPDRWYSLTETASINVRTLQDGENGVPYCQRLTQSQASAQRMGRAQIIEGINCRHARGQTVTLSGRIRCSSSQAIRYAVLEWTGTADSVTSDVVSNWASGSYTAGGFFLGSNLTVAGVGAITPAANTWTDLTALSPTLSGSLNNLIVLIWTEGQAAQNVTLDFRLKLEVGAQATAFVPRSLGEELALCMRYFEKSVAMGRPITLGGNTSWFVPFTSVGNGAVYFQVMFAQRKRVTPTVTTYPFTTPSNTGRWSNNAGTDYGANSAGTSNGNEVSVQVFNASGGTLTIGQNLVFGGWYADAEL